MASQPATTSAAASDLISFLKALPDCRMRRGIRFPQWWMLLVAILSILRSLLKNPAVSAKMGQLPS